MTAVVILAAGQGERLRPLTDDRPKCLVDIAGKSLLQRQLDIFRSAGLSRIAVVGGYREERLRQAVEPQGLQVFRNSGYRTTNMVASLFAASDLMREEEEDLLVVYGDIHFERNVLDAVLACNSQLCVAIDIEWRRLWELRMEDPLDDAETLRLDSRGAIVELGCKPRSYDDIQGQYMGLFKVCATSLPAFLSAYDGLDRNSQYRGVAFGEMYMTTFLQCLIDQGWHAKAVQVKGGWLEVDTMGDLQTYEQLYAQGELGRYCQLD